MERACEDTLRRFTERVCRRLETSRSSSKLFCQAHHVRLSLSLARSNALLMLSTCYLGSAYPLRHIRLWHMLDGLMRGHPPNDTLVELVLGDRPAIPSVMMRAQVAVGTLPRNKAILSLVSFRHIGDTLR